MKAPILAALGVLAACLAPGAQAAVVGDLYASEVELAGRDNQSTQAGIREALNQVLVKVTGRRDAAQDEGFEALRNDASQLMQQWSYTATGLWAAFDAGALDRALLERSLPRWGTHRPRTVVWIAFEENGAPARLLGAEGAPLAGAYDGLIPVAPEHLPSPLLVRPAQQWPPRPPVFLPPPGSVLPAAPGRPVAPIPGPGGEQALSLLPDPGHAALRDRLQRAAMLRGLPLVLPQLDGQDLWRVRPETVCAASDPALVAASRRYHASAVLLGCARLFGDTAAVRWTLLAGGRQWSWVGGPEEGVHRVADLMAQEMAARGNQLSHARLRVDGVNSLGDYGRMISHLEGLALVDAVEVEAIEGGTLYLGARIWDDSERLQRALAMGRVLVPVVEGNGAGPPRYRLWLQ